MNRPEFELVMKTMVQEYDPNGVKGAYGPGRIEAIFAAFSKLSGPQFKALVMRAFQSERTAPMAKDLKRIWNEMQDEEYQRQKQRSRDTATAVAEGGSRPSPEQISAILEPYFNRVGKRFGGTDA